MELFTIGFALCVIGGLLCFALFAKLLDWFDKI